MTGAGERIEDARGRPAAAALFLGVLGLNIIGVTPVLLGALFDLHRLTAGDIGLSAMLELASMGLTAGLAGAVAAPRRLRLVALSASLVLAGVDAGSALASGWTFLTARAVAGVPEGLLVWIAVGLIARTRAPDRWAAMFFTAQTLAQLATAVLFWRLVLPRFGPDGGFLVLAAGSLLGVPAAFATPAAYAPLAPAGRSAAALPPLGWFALAAIFVVVMGNAAVSVYLQPLAGRAGLSADVARLANVVSLSAQVAGGLLATALAGRVGYLAVFVTTTAGFLIVWAVYGLATSGGLFIAASGLAGLLALLVGPFLTPLAIAADPSRRTAVQSAAPQIFGGAAGPFGAAFVVSDAEPRGVLVYAALCMTAGLVMIWIIHERARHVR